MIFFDSRNILKHRSVPLGSLPVLWHKQVLTQNSDIPSWAWIFSKSEFTETTKNFSAKLSGTVRQTFFDRSLWYPILMLKIFRYPIFSETQKGVHLRIISVLWEKTFSTDNLVTPTAPLHRNFDKRVFLKRRTFRLQSFLLRWDKKFPKETRGIPLLCINFFDTWTFLRHRRAPLRSFWYRETKQFRLKMAVPAPFFYPQHFSTPEIGETLEGSHAKVFGTVKQKVCGGELWCSINLRPQPLILYFLRFQKISSNTERFLYEMFR